MTRLLEIRTYRLKPGTHEAFHVAMRERAVPFIRSKGMDVVAFGKSDHEEPCYFLARAYSNREALEREQSQFYGSDAWKTGPRQELVDKIESYLNTLVWLSEAAVENMRQLNADA